jgi:bifunctional NMN adenylyltransferase/nudix hydrolase
MNIKTSINPKDFEVGVIIARFQTNKLHDGHIHLIDHVLSNHKKVVVLLGVSKVPNTKKNPLDFASRMLMIQARYPNLTILPIRDQRSDEKWSQSVDEMISSAYGYKKTVIYGSRDSFIPYYSGKNTVIELEPSVNYSATNVREAVAKETLPSEDFRAGVIYQAYNNRPVTYPTVDICVYNNHGEILLAKKPNEKHWRFVGGFVDPEDTSWEMAAKRELREETGGSLEIHKPNYVLSHRVNDWRYQGEEDGIMTSLFLAERHFGLATASDDIEQVSWFPVQFFSNYDGIRTKIMPEHREMMIALIDKVYNEQLIPNIGERLAERENVTYTIE